MDERIICHDVPVSFTVTMNNVYTVWTVDKLFTVNIKVNFSNQPCKIILYDILHCNVYCVFPCSTFEDR